MNLLMHTIAFFLLVLTGCTTIQYHPSQSLYSASVNLEQKNLTNLTLGIRCYFHSNRFYTLQNQETETLCSYVTRLLETQGATIKESDEESDLTLEFVIEDTIISNPPISRFERILHYGTYTLFPVSSVETKVITLTTYDKNLNPISENHLEGTLSLHEGLGFFLMNTFANSFLRTPEEQITNQTSQLQMSRDFYSQITRITLNHKSRLLVRDLSLQKTGD